MAIDRRPGKVPAELQDELWERILRRLNQSERAPARMTCKLWNKMILRSTNNLRHVGKGFIGHIGTTDAGEGRFTSANAQLEWYAMIRFLESIPKLKGLGLLAAPHHCLSDLRALTALETLNLGGPMGVGQEECRGIDAAPLSAMKLRCLEVGRFRLQGPFEMPHCIILGVLMASASLSCIPNFHALKRLKLFDIGLAMGDTTLQGVLSLPNLEEISITGRRFDLLDIQCPQLSFLAIDYQKQQGQRQLNRLSGLTKLTCLCLLRATHSVDLLALTQLRAMALVYSAMPITPSNLSHLDIMNLPQQGFDAGRLGRVTGLETLVLGPIRHSMLSKLLSLLKPLENLKNLGVDGQGITDYDIPHGMATRLECLDLGFKFKRAARSLIHKRSPFPMVDHGYMLQACPAMHHL